MKHLPHSPSHHERDTSCFVEAQAGASTPPRHRMRGGDLPRGGTPLGLGHAGLMHQQLRASLLCLATALLFVVATFVSFAIPSGRGATSLFATRTALAQESLTFANGNTAQRHADGTITGTCSLVAHWVGDTVRFTLTMPDDAEVQAECHNPDYFTPVNGDNYEFVATPRGEGKGYDVVIEATMAKVYQDKLHDTIESEDDVPIQQVGTNTQDEKAQLWYPEGLSGKCKLFILKSSSYPALLESENFSLEGARYGVWKDSALKDYLGEEFDLITDASGNSNVIELPSGSYWIKEKVAPKGFALDKAVYGVSLPSSGLLRRDVTDIPESAAPQIWATKVDDSHLGFHGNATFAGAEVIVRYYDRVYLPNEPLGEPFLTWRLKADEDGNIKPDEAHSVGDNPAFVTTGSSRNSKVLIPYGTMTIQEVKAPTGYALEKGGESEELGPIHRVVVKSPSFEPIVIHEPIISGGVEITKVDTDLKKAQAQGDATLAGTEFEILHDDKRVATITTDEHGHAATAPDALPYGSYTIREVAAPRGYLVNEGFTKDFSITEAGQMENLGAVCPETVIRGGIMVKKVSRETLSNTAQGGASLEGAVFDIINDSEHDVMVKGKAFKPGEVVYQISTNSEGVAKTNATALPYGTYRVRESSAPEGYELDDGWEGRVKVLSAGAMHVLEDNEVVREQVMRGDLRFVKVNGQTKKPLAGIPFRLTSTTTGESHVVVSDDNGVVSTAGAVHSYHTNKNDDAVKPDGSVQENALSSLNGIWFAGDKDREVAANDARGALPYDTYRIVELSCARNNAFKLVARTFEITEQGQRVDLGNVEDEPRKTDDEPVAPKDETPKDKPSSFEMPRSKATPASDESEGPSIATTLLAGNGEHITAATKDVRLTDTVVFNGLQPNTMYVLEARLINKDTYSSTSEQGSVLVTKRSEFAVSEESGITKIDLEVDASQLAGSSVVCFETLYQKNGNDLAFVASHEDIDDEGQTVHFPSIRTTLATAAGKHEDHPYDSQSTVQMRDYVEYKNLIPNVTYELQGTLMDKKTGKPLDNDKADSVQTTIQFTPTSISSGQGVNFNVNAGKLPDTHIVAFEKLLYKGEVIATHEDLNDSDQTVWIAGTSKATSGTKDAAPDTSDATGNPVWLLLLGLVAVIASLPMRRRNR